MSRDEMSAGKRVLSPIAGSSGEESRTRCGGEAILDEDPSPGSALFGDSDSDSDVEICSSTVRYSIRVLPFLQLTTSDAKIDANALTAGSTRFDSSFASPCLRA